MTSATWARVQDSYSQEERREKKSRVQQSPDWVPARAAASEFDWTSAAKDALLCASAGGFAYPPARLGLAPRFAGPV
jgi:hypothetical protein